MTRLPILVILLFGLAACGADVEPSQAPSPNIQFSSQPIDVASTGVSTSPMLQPQGVRQELLLDSLNQWFNQRFQAAGNIGHLELEVTDLTLNKSDVSPKKSSILKDELSERIEGKLAVTLKIFGERRGIPKATAQLQASEYTELLESATAYERDAAIARLVENLIHRIDESAVQQLRQNMPQLFTFTY